MTENLAGRGEGLAGLGDELNQCLQIIVTNAGNIVSFNVGAFRDEDIHGAALAIEKAVDRAAKAIRAALEAAAPQSTPAKTPVDEPKNDDRAYGCYTCGKQGLKKGQRVSLVYCNECDAKHIEEVRRAALATPSPQAPLNECKNPDCPVGCPDSHTLNFDPDAGGSPRKVGEDGASERIWCMECGKSVSTPVPRDTIVRAWVQCPECIEKGKGL